MALSIDSSGEYSEAIRETSALLDALRLQHAFVGRVAVSAWLQRRMNQGPVDVLAMLTPERMRQVPMMASHRGFSADPKEIENAEELDLIPLRFRNIRVHVLMATNALYGRMLAESVEATLERAKVRLVTAEDLALLLLMADDYEALDELIAAHPDLNIDTLNRKLVSIGLAARTIRR